MRWSRRTKGSSNALTRISATTSQPRLGSPAARHTATGRQRPEPTPNVADGKVDVLAVGIVSDEEGDDVEARVQETALGLGLGELADERVPDLVRAVLHRQGEEDEASGDLGLVRPDDGEAEHERGGLQPETRRKVPAALAGDDAGIRVEDRAEQIEDGGRQRRRVGRVGPRDAAVDEHLERAQTGPVVVRQVRIRAPE